MAKPIYVKTGSEWKEAKRLYTKKDDGWKRICKFNVKTSDTTWSKQLSMCEFVQEINPSPSNIYMQATCRAQAVYRKVCEYCGEPSQEWDMYRWGSYDYNNHVEQSSGTPYGEHETASSDGNCQTSGWKAYACDACNLQTKKIDTGLNPNIHVGIDSSKDTLATPGNCITNAFYDRYCYCGNWLKKEQISNTTDPSNHAGATNQAYPTKLPTCSTKGETYIYCSECLGTDNEGKDIYILPENPNNHESVTYTPGYSTSTPYHILSCTACGIQAYQTEECIYPEKVSCVAGDATPSFLCEKCKGERPEATQEYEVEHDTFYWKQPEDLTNPIHKFTCTRCGQEAISEACAPSIIEYHVNCDSGDIFAGTWYMTDEQQQAGVYDSDTLECATCGANVPIKNLSGWTVDKIIIDHSTPSEWTYNTYTLGTVTFHNDIKTCTRCNRTLESDSHLCSRYAQKGKYCPHCGKLVT